MNATPSATGRQPVRRRAAGGARLWWTLHQWAGLKLALFMTFVMFTGTLAVFSHEIGWLLRPALRVAPASVTGPTDWVAVAEGAAKAMPSARISRIEAPVGRGFAAQVAASTAKDKLIYIYVHPTTGAVQGQGPIVGAQVVLRRMHRHLMLPVDIGVPIVTSLALLLTVTLGTSFLVYKRWWRGFLKPIRLRTARLAWGDFHRLAGVWSMWFLAVIIVTSLWYLVESLGGEAPPHPSVDVPPTMLEGPALAARLGPSLAAAQASYPDLRIEGVIFPSSRNGAFQFQGQNKAILVRDRANAVWAAVDSGETRLVADARHLDLHQRISEAADPLHFGTFGGLPTKIIWFAFGLALTGLCVSGVAIYGLRIARGRDGRTPAKAAALAGWRGMGAWRWVSIAAVATALALLPSLIAATGD